MIKLEKGEKPQILVNKGAAWLDAVKQKRAAGKQPSAAELGRYRHAQIKAALVKETHGKCAYCEAKILHIAYGDVEHVTPKDTDEDLRFDWDNLTLACDVCNTNKSNHTGLVDPYTDDPEELFFFIGAMLMPVSGEKAAERTETLLRLNRPDLIQRRHDRMLYLKALLSVINNTVDASQADALKEDLTNNELSANVEFAAASRSFIRACRH